MLVIKTLQANHLLDQIQGDVTMDVSALAEGVYFVSVEGTWGAATRRIVLSGSR